MAAHATVAEEDYLQTLYWLFEAGRTIDFTVSGREHAEHIVSRHRMIERFLTDVVGVPWDDVHEEAEHLEHAMTPRFEAYVRASVGDAATCPHGHPIEP